MTDSKRLKQIIVESGIKITTIAEKMGISRHAFYEKLNNKSAFNQYEIADLCKILGIQSLKDKERIFFCPESDK